MLARQGVTLLALAEKDVVPLAFLTSAVAAKGQVELFCDKRYTLPANLENVQVRTIADRKERARTLARRADCFVVLPGSLATATSQFLSISDQKTSVPMVFLNQNNAFEILRGFSADVFVHTFPKAHKQVQFAQSVEDIWPLVTRLTDN